MKKFGIYITSECISAANGRPYNSDHYEGQNVREAENAKAAIQAEIDDWKFENVKSIEWFDNDEDPELGPSAVVIVSLEDGGEKHFFFN